MWPGPQMVRGFSQNLANRKICRFASSSPRTKVLLGRLRRDVSRPRETTLNPEFLSSTIFCIRTIHEATQASHWPDFGLWEPCHNHSGVEAGCHAVTCPAGWSSSWRAETQGKMGIMCRNLESAHPICHATWLCFGPDRTDFGLSHLKAVWLGIYTQVRL